MCCAGCAGELHRAEGGKRNGSVVLVSYSVYRSSSSSLSIDRHTTTPCPFHTGTLFPWLVGRRPQETLPIFPETAAIHESQKDPPADTERQVSLTHCFIVLAERHSAIVTMRRRLSVVLRYLTRVYCNSTQQSQNSVVIN